jgi:thioredoxin reductase (NADPH)
MHDLVIIGGGPAGLAAAIYALGKQLDVVVIARDLGGKAEYRQRLVGQLADEYLAGEESVRLFEQRVSAAGIVRRDRVREVTHDGGRFQLTTDHHGALEATAVIIATGASPIPLDVPGASEFLGQGLGYSPTTHAHMVQGKNVAIVGHTIRALRGAAELAETAGRVYVVAPDPSPFTLPLAEALRDRPNVEVLAGAEVTEIAGSFSVEEIVVRQGSETRRLGVDLAFVDLGLYANSGMVRELLNLGPGMYIPVNEKNETQISGLFAAGDVTTLFGEQTLIAIGEGARAALGAYDFILNQRMRRPR